MEKQFPRGHSSSLSSDLSGLLKPFWKVTPSGSSDHCSPSPPPRQAYNPHISPGCSSSGSGLRRCGRSVPGRSCPPRGLLGGRRRREASPPPDTGPRRSHPGRLGHKPDASLSFPRERTCSHGRFALRWLAGRRVRVRPSVKTHDSQSHTSSRLTLSSERADPEGSSLRRAPEGGLETEPTLFHRNMPVGKTCHFQSGIYFEVLKVKGVTGHRLTGSGDWRNQSEFRASTLRIRYTFFFGGQGGEGMV